MKKFILLLSAVVLASLINQGNAHAFAKGAEQECIKCHTINSEQAKEVLKGLAPDVKILQIQAGPVNGFWEVGIESGGRKNIVYIDFSKKKVIVGNIIDAQTKASYTKTSFDKINKVDVSQIPLENSIVLGPKDAKYKIVVFDDPD